MLKNEINFRIKPYKIDEKILEVELKVNNLSSTGEIKLFAGKVRWFDIKCSHRLRLKGALAHVECLDGENLTLNYGYV